MADNGYADGSIVVDADLNTQGFEAGSDQMRSAVDSSIKAYEKLGETLGATSQQAQKFVDAWAKAMPAKEFEAGVDTMTKQVEGMAGKLSEVEQLYKRALDGESGAISQFESKAASAEAGLDKIGAKMEELYNSVVKTENAELIKGSDMDSIGALIRQFDDLNASLAAMQDKIAAVKGASDNMVPSAAPQADETAQALGRTAEQAEKTAEATNDATKKTGILLSTLRAVGRVGAASFKAAGKAVTALGKGVAALKNRFTQSGDGAMKAAKSVTKSLTSFGARIKSLLKRRMIRAVLNGAIEGVKNLAQVSPAVNAAMSSLVTSLSQLKNSFGTAFAPILTAVTPVLTKLIDLLSEAFTKVGMFISALTGATSFKKATTVQKDYAASLNDTADSAKKAQKALAGFDELNNTTTSSSDSTSTDVSSMFEDVPIESKIKNFADRIKRAFLSGDFEGIGAAAAEKVNSIFKKINKVMDDETVTSKVVGFVTGMIKGFNRFIADVDFEQIGATVGKGINKIVDVIHAFWTTVDWKKLGSQLASGINGIVKNVNWKKLGSTIGARFQGVLSFLNGAIHEFDFNGLAKSIGDAINSALASIDWAMLGETLSTGIKKLFDMISTFASTVDWKAIGENLASFLNNIDWAGVFGSLAQALSAVLSGLLDTLIAFVSTLDWEKLGKALWNSLVAIVTNIQWGELVSKAFKLLGAAIAGLGNLFRGLIEAIWNGIKNAYNGLKSYFSKKIEDCGGNIILGILKGIVDALVGIGEWIWDHIFKPIWDGICSVFGIHSPSTKMMEIGKDLILGLLEGLGELLWDVLSWFGDLALNILEALASLPGELYDLGKNLINNIWDGIKSVAKTLKDGAVAVAGWVWDGIKALPEKALQLGKDIIDGICNGIKWCLNKIKEAVKWIKDAITSGFKSIVSANSEEMEAAIEEAEKKAGVQYQTFGQHIIDNMNAGIQSKYDDLQKTTEGAAQIIRNLLGFTEPKEGPLSNFHTFMPDMIDLMCEGIEQNKRAAFNAVADLAQGMADEAKDASVLIPIEAENKYTAFLNNFADRVTSAFLLLIQRLEAIANGVTFATPALASGTILPYRIAGPAGASDNGGGQPGLTAIIERMDRIEEKLDEVVTAIDEKETGITDAEIYSSVKESARKDKKSTGRDPFSE